MCAFGVQGVFSVGRQVLSRNCVHRMAIAMRSFPRVAWRCGLEGQRGLHKASLVSRMFSGSGTGSSSRLAWCSRIPSSPLGAANTMCIQRAAFGTSAMAQSELEQRLATFNDQFAEARLCLADALESKETTYFKDDIRDAKEAMDKTLEIYTQLLDDLSEEQRAQVDDANGLKVKSLQEEYDQLVMDDDH